VIKEWCAECKGKRIVVEKESTASMRYTHKYCEDYQGNGYIEREVKAEDLSVEEQRDIASHWYGDFLEGKVDFNDPINSWDGMKK